VYESEITQKKYEMKALQNQINPHFLYNTLSLINWKAIENGNKDISEITLALSNFYRTSLNKGKNVLPVADEIKNVKSYIAVQLFMHDYDFDVEYDIDEEIMGYESLNLILQPIVENAIEHGLEVMEEDKRGLLIIKGWLQDNKIYISVTDNGVGMDEDKAATIITQHSKGYGMRNVHERIRLFYGDEYGLSVHSEIDKGTTITVCIPANCA
jgi:two-component system sensor histidine kinase YesM